MPRGPTLHAPMRHNGDQARRWSLTDMAGQEIKSTWTPPPQHACSTKRLPQGAPLNTASRLLAVPELHLHLICVRGCVLKDGGAQWLHLPGHEDPHRLVLSKSFLLHILKQAQGSGQCAVSATAASLLREREEVLAGFVHPLRPNLRRCPFQHLAEYINIVLNHSPERLRLQLGLPVWWRLRCRRRGRHKDRFLAPPWLRCLVLLRLVDLHLRLGLGDGRAGRKSHPGDGQSRGRDGRSRNGRSRRGRSRHRRSRNGRRCRAELRRALLGLAVVAGTAARPILLRDSTKHAAATTR
mmetsp:Transcript_69105/g.147887  ORF Transcript_69105/g.147887 Transcript_69105/m.147887 type:complete len:296 (-) Transcript_69105:637-1524(-)